MIPSITPKDGKSWYETFSEVPLYPVSLSRTAMARWGEIHHWCSSQYGNRNYTWTGCTFWFETEKDAILFALRFL